MRYVWYILSITGGQRATVINRQKSKKPTLSGVSEGRKIWFGVRFLSHQTIHNSFFFFRRWNTEKCILLVFKKAFRSSFLFFFFFFCSSLSFKEKKEKKKKKKKSPLSVTDNTSVRYQAKQQHFVYSVLLPTPSTYFPIHHVCFLRFCCSLRQGQCALVQGAPWWQEGCANSIWVYRSCALGGRHWNFVSIYNRFC